MLRNILLSQRNLLNLSLPTARSSISSRLRGAHSNSNSLPAAPQFTYLSSPEETDEARAWISRFKSRSITKESVEMSFSRSSGPGGQVCITNDMRVLTLGLNIRFKTIATECEQGEYQGDAALSH
jgi:peptidyl-tRNA hydrolase ICT1